MTLLSDPQVWIGFTTLLLLEIVLGIDNIVFISILAGKLPEGERDKARKLGLSLALITRILLLLSISWMVRLTTPFTTILGQGVNGKQIILILGGLFLIAKATVEIHQKLEGEEEEVPSGKHLGPTFSAVVTQILLIDIVFSLDSVITAVGMVKQVEIMIAAVIVSVLFMLWFSGAVSNFVNKHPTVKMLALAFLILIGFNLVAEGFGQKIEKGYTYFAMAFALGVEMLNLRLRRHAHLARQHPELGPKPPEPSETPQR